MVHRGLVMRPDRRQVLALTATGLACASLAPRLRARDDDEHGAQDPEHECDLTVALLESKRLGKPLLVLSLTDEAVLFGPSERMELLTWYLTECDEAALLDLALCEIVCVSPAQARAHLVIRPADADAMMFLVEAQRGDSTARAVTLDLPPAPEPAHLYSDEERANYAKAKKARIDAVAKGVRATLLPGESSLRDRMGELQATLTEDERAGLAAGLKDPEQLTPALADRAAPFLLWTAASHPLGEELRARVLEGASFRTQVNAPRGGAWVQPDFCPPCGMAFPTTDGRKFLDLYGRLAGGAPSCDADG
jgi:hypothetical protein